ncbi:MAG: hypothetical protein JRG75_04005 [Deltaproteobacteria bacterium]|nr:hypothetical protein [Deltaproteobacteria bacterium]
MADKTAEALAGWCSGDGIEFINAEAEAAYKRRVGRIADVIQLKIPDRVPVVPSFGMFPYLDNGLTCEEAVFDYEKADKAAMKTLKEFEPDMFIGSAYACPAPLFEALGYRQLRWPGREIPAHYVYQFVEAEYVTDDEFYDAYLDDPTDFMLRVYLPRICTKLKPLEMIRPFSESFGYYLTMTGSYACFGLPEVQEALKALMKAGEESLKWVTILTRQAEEIMSRGFPLSLGGSSAAPYDLVGAWFRGTTGVMTDMYRCPDKLLAVMEKLVPIAIKMGLDPAKGSRHPLIGFMLHKGADGFMSPEQFNTFYWPTLRKVMMGLIDEGYVPVLLCEGEYTSRLETIADIPRGKCIYWFEKVDWSKAKEILGDTVCIRGGVSPSLIFAGTIQAVKDCVKERIDVLGKGGGYIVDCGIWFDEAKRENVKAMIEFTKEYGVYG